MAEKDRVFAILLLQLAGEENYEFFQPTPISSV